MYGGHILGVSVRQFSTIYVYAELHVGLHSRSVYICVYIVCLCTILCITHLNSEKLAVTKCFPDLVFMDKLSVAIISSCIHITKVSVIHYMKCNDMYILLRYRGYKYYFWDL